MIFYCYFLKRITSSTFIFFKRRQVSYMASSNAYPSLDPTINSAKPIEPNSRSDPVSTYSTQVGLAKALQERGVGHSIAGWTWSGLSTPNNSPDASSPDGSPSHYFYGPLELLQQGAKLIRRTLTGEETPVSHRQRVPRISRTQLEVFFFYFL